MMGMPLCTPSQIGPYEILAPLGEGGMGEEYHETELEYLKDLSALDDWPTPYWIATSAPSFRRAS